MIIPKLNSIDYLQKNNKSKESKSKEKKESN